MYLISQLWWLLALAFLLGALVGYFLWRACGRRFVVSDLERRQRNLQESLAAAEAERRHFMHIAGTAETERSGLLETIESLKASLAHVTSKAAVARSDEDKARAAADENQRRAAELAAELETLKRQNKPGARPRG
ncbi:MAG: hypothetical protein ACRCS9_09885 [Hyphomicrobium sp.]